MAALQFGAASGAEEPVLPGGSFGAADSFPKDFGYGAEDDDDEDDDEAAELGGGGGPGGGGGCGLGPGGGDASKQPRILLMGLRRSGKSSIQKVGAAAASPDACHQGPGGMPLGRNPRRARVRCSSQDSAASPQTGLEPRPQGGWTILHCARSGSWPLFLFATLGSSSLR